MRTRGALVLVLTVLPALAGCGSEPPAPQTLQIRSALGGEPDSGFVRVLEPKPFVFPIDHGPHPQYKTEWWYVTANLSDQDGRQYGVQFTVFRSALRPPTNQDSRPEDGSAWSSPQVYMAHVAVTDAHGGRFYAEERFAREALGLAGATVSPFRVWLEDIEISSENVRVGPGESAPTDIFPLRMQANLGATELDLRLGNGKPLVLQGDRGYSPKGPGVGDASHYYSFTRLPISGSLVVDGVARDVSGTAWLDREWSTSVLSRDQVGWDWFAVQLDDGRDLMMFVLRSTDGGAVRDGVVVAPDGTSRRLDSAGFQIEVLGTWSSRVDGASYPSGWRVRVPAHQIDVTLSPLIEDQEHVGAFRYWEGAVRVTESGVPAGVGYVELTGYAEGAAAASAGALERRD